MLDKFPSMEQQEQMDLSDISLLELPFSERQGLQEEFFTVPNPERRAGVFLRAFRRHMAHILAAASIVLGAETVRPVSVEAQATKSTEQVSQQRKPIIEDKKLLDKYQKLRERVKASGLEDSYRLFQRKFGDIYFGKDDSREYPFENLKSFFMNIDIIESGFFLDHPDQKVDRNLNWMLAQEKLFTSKELLKVREKQVKKEGIYSMKIIGFDSIPGFSNEKMQELMGKFDPYFINGEIGLIRYVDQFENEGTMEKIDGRARETDRPSLFGSDTVQAVILYKKDWDKVRIKYGNKDEPQTENNEYLEKYFFGLVAHEVGHHIDWKGSAVLTLPEGLQFFFEVEGRLDASDRFKSAYIDSIIPVALKEWKESLRYVQTKEYFASIIEEYLVRPEELKEKNPVDYALADKWYNLQIVRLEVLKPDLPKQLTKK